MLFSSGDIRSVFFAVAVLFLIIAQSQCHRSPLPIKPDEEELDDSDEELSVCRLGNDTYELGEQWHPDLGAPYGVQLSIMCACVSHKDKNRLRAKIHCGQTWRKCAKTICLRSRSPQEHCCRNTADEHAGRAPSSARKRKSEEKKPKEFAVLMTPPIVSSNDLNSNSSNNMPGSLAAAESGIVTGRLQLLNHRLLFSFFYQLNTEPTCVSFRDSNDNIVEEIKLSKPSTFQRVTSKVSGKWKVVARDYRRMLRGGTMMVALVKCSERRDREQTEKILAQGTIRRAPDTEVLSSLLTPAAGAAVSNPLLAATAMIEFPHTESVKIKLIVRQSVGVRVTLLQVQLHLGEEVPVAWKLDISVAEGQSEFVAEVRKQLTDQQLNQLTGGEAQLSVTVLDGHSQSVAGPSLMGTIMPRFKCNLFLAHLLASDTASAQQRVNSGDSGVDPSSTGHGLVMFSLWNNFSFTMTAQISLTGTEAQVQIFSAEDGANMVANLTAIPTTDWFSVTLSLSRLQLLLLLSERLHVRVISGQQISGRLTTLSLPKRLNRVEVPELLHPVPGVVATGALWMSVGKHCRVKLYVQCKGVECNSGFKVELQQYMEKNGEQYSRFLHLYESYDWHFEKTLKKLRASVLLRLKEGKAVLRLKARGATQSSETRVLVTSALLKVHVPSQCLPRGLTRVNGFFQDEMANEGQPNKAAQCQYEGRLYGDGLQWDATHTPCSVCTCRRGKVNCVSEPCPTVNCSRQSRPDNVCCPVCSRDRRVSVGESGALAAPLPSCSLGNRTRPLGSVWHPFLPPNGFDLCVTCQCVWNESTQTAVVSCDSKACSPLNCAVASSTQIRTSDLCCRPCDDVSTSAQSGSSRQAREDGVSSSIVGMLNDEVRPNSSAYLTARGCKRFGTVYTEGQTWSPRLDSIGEIKHISCHCKNGIIKCESKLDHKRSDVVVN